MVEDYIKRTTPLMHAARMEFLMWKSPSSRKRADPRQDNRRVNDISIHAKARTEQPNAPIPGYDYGQLDEGYADPPYHTRHDTDDDGTSTPEDSKAYPYGRYVTYKGEVYELAPVGTEPKLMDLENWHDEAEVALTKGTWLQRLGRKSE